VAAWEERGFARDAETFRAAVRDLIERRPGPDTSVSELVGLGFDLVVARTKYYRDRSRSELASRLSFRVEVASRYVDAIAMAMSLLPAERLRRTDHVVAARVVMLAVFSAAHNCWSAGLEPDVVARVRTELVAMATSYLLRDGGA
jgi:hypothetical protein